MNPHMLIGAKLSTLMNLIRRNTPASADAPPSEVSRVQGMIIGYLSDHNGIALQKDIEETFMLRPSTISRTLKLMDKNGLIERVYLQDDARLKKIVLTDKARESFAAIREHIQLVERRLVENISQEDLDTFQRVLSQMIDNMNT